MKKYFVFCTFILNSLCVNYCISGYRELSELQLAVESGEIAVLLRYIKEGVDFNVRHKDGDPLIIRAAENGQLEVLRLLLKHGARLSSYTEIGDTALLRASQNGHVSVVKELLEQKADINHANMYMRTALSMAVMNNHTNIVRTLVKHGANVDIYHINGNPILFDTVLQGKLGLAQILIDNGACVNLRTYPDNQTLLMLGAIYEDEKLINKILEMEVDVNAVDKKGCSALMYAVYLRKKEVLKELIRAGANLNVQDLEKKQTALLYAAANEYEEECNLLINSGADFFLADLYGGTPLTRALATGNKQIIDLLINAGAKNTLFTETVRRADAELTLMEVKNLDGTIKMWFNSETINEVPEWSDISPHLNKGSPLYLRKGLDVLGNQYALGSKGSWCRVNIKTVKKFEELLGGKEESKRFWGKYLPDGY